MSVLAHRTLHDSTACLTHRVRVLNALFSTTTAAQAGKAPWHARGSVKTKRLNLKKPLGPPLKPLEEDAVHTNKIKQHLKKIEKTKNEFTLDDIERHKPAKVVDYLLVAYDKIYSEVRRVIFKSFTLQQLQKFVELYGLKPPQFQLKNKHMWAEVIMEHWGMKPLRTARAERALWRTTTDEDIPMSPGFAYLFVGRDGADLIDLAKRYSVHLSFNPNPLQLRIQGLQGAVNQVKGYVDVFRKDIATKTVTIPLGLTLLPELTQEISRLSGAYAEVGEDGKMHVTYRKSKPETLGLLQRLAIQTASQVAFNASSQRAILPPILNNNEEPSSTDCSLYPFFPSQVTSSKLQAESPFRMRRVGQWLSSGTGYGTVEKTKEITSLSKPDQIDIRQLLNARLGDVRRGARRTVTALTGHVLFLSDQKTLTLVPPISGTVEPDAALKLAADKPERMVFNSGVPKDVMMAWPEEERWLRRLLYKSYDATGEEAGLRKTLKVEIHESTPPISPTSEGPEATEEGSHDTESVGQSKVNVICTHSVETSLDVMLPSRRTDLRITGEDAKTIPSSLIPPKLQDYLQDRKAPLPLILDFKGQTYILVSSSRLTQSRHHQQMSEEKSMTCIVETTKDSEDGLNFTECKIQHDNVTWDHEWKNFLSQCDFLTMMDSRPAFQHPFDVFDEWSGTKPNRKQVAETPPEIESVESILTKAVKRLQLEQELEER